MAELELARVKGDRKLYSLADVGTVRYAGLLSSHATVEGAGGSWQVYSDGGLRNHVTAVDAGGATVGEFESQKWRSGGTVRWAGRELTLLADGPVGDTDEVTIADGDRELVKFSAKGWRKQTIRVTLEDPAAFEPGLLLFATVVARWLIKQTAGDTG